MIVLTNMIEELDETLSRGSVSHRVEMLRRVTDLFSSGSVLYSDEQIALFDDVFRRLVFEIETSARAILATRLAAIPNAPPAIIRTLASDDTIEVAGPVLSHSERLDEATLIETARTKSQRHLLAISRRRSLGQALTDVLVGRGNRWVVKSTAENSGAKFSEAGFAKLVERSEHDDALAESVGSRRDIPRHHFLKLLAKASEAVRTKLEAEHLDPAAAAVKRAVAEAAERIQTESRARSRDYVTAKAAVYAMHVAGQLNDAAVAAFARANKFEETTAALSTLAKLPIALVERIMVEERAEAVLILAKVAGVSWHTLKALLLLRAGQGWLSADELDQCMASFDRLKLTTAQQVVRFHRMREVAPPRSDADGPPPIAPE